MPSTWMEVVPPPLCSTGPWPVTPRITGKSTSATFEGEALAYLQQSHPVNIETLLCARPWVSCMSRRAKNSFLRVPHCPHLGIWDSSQDSEVRLRKWLANIEGAFHQKAQCMQREGTISGPTRGWSYLSFSRICLASRGPEFKPQNPH